MPGKVTYNKKNECKLDYYYGLLINLSTNRWDEYYSLWCCFFWRGRWIEWVE